MEDDKFKDIIQSIGGIWIQGELKYDKEDLIKLNLEQLNQLIVAMLIHSQWGMGSFHLTNEYYMLLEFLSENYILSEDESLTRILRSTVSMICLNGFQNLPFEYIFEQRLARHLRNIFGKNRMSESTSFLDYPIILATYLAYPILERVLKTYLSRWIAKDGKVIKEFKIPGKSYKKGDLVSSMKDELLLLQQITDNDMLRLSLKKITKYHPIDRIYEYRNLIIHGVMAGHWYSIALTLIIYLLIINYN